MSQPSDFVRVPADGAGKRVTSKEYIDSDGQVYYTQVVNVGDRTNPNVQQTVKPDGSALVEFSTGAPIFNAFNRLLTTTDDLLSAFKFYEGPKAVSTKIAENVVGSGTVAYDTSNLSYRCRVPAGAGHKAQISSHRRFSYKPGSSITTYFVVGGNSPNQTNVSRRAGLFDDDDGLFMEMLDGVIYCVIRKGGVDTRVAQADWNGDRMDGSEGDFNRSAATLDPTKMNIFSITYQYLSAGAVTFGHYVGGVPTVLHTVGHHGALTSPYMNSTYLPHRFEIETTGAGQVGDTDLYTWCSVSMSEGYTDLIRTPLGFEETKTLSDSADTPIISFRPAQTYLGTDNRYRYLLQYVNSFSSSEPVILTLHAGTVLSGATWTDSLLGIEFDYGATSILGSLAYGKNMCPAAGVNSINLTAIGGDASTDGLFRKDDITDTDVWTISARRLSGSGSTDVTISGSFFQVE